MRTYNYSAYGITFTVPFPCPGLPAAAPGAVADVVLREGAVARGLSSPVVSDDRWDAEPDRFLVRGGQRAGRFLVESDGVTLDRNPGAQDDVLARCFTGEVLPALLRHRGLLVLHANAALTPDGVVVVAGESGSGKSTTLAALIERGCVMLADDVTALTLSGDGCVDVLPGVAQVHLTAAAARGLGYHLAPELLQPWRRMKAAMATDRSMADAPGRLSSIYVLTMHDGAELSLIPLAGAQKLAALQNCIFGPLLADQHPTVFPLCKAVLGTADIYELGRPREGWTVAEVTDTVLGARVGVSP